MLTFTGEQLIPFMRGAVDFSRDGEQIIPLRHPIAQEPLWEPQLARRSRGAAGVRLSFTTDASAFRVKVDPRLNDPAAEHLDNWTLDLLVDGELYDRKTQPRAAETLTFNRITDDLHRIDLYLDHVSGAGIESLELIDATTCSPIETNHLPWLIYGSSITQSGAAYGPSETWPALVARKAGVEHYNFGYGGNAQLDNVAARLIGSIPAALISVCANTNNYGAYAPRTFRAAVIGFLLTIRDQQPTTPLVLCSAIFGEHQETTKSESGLTLQHMREAARSAYDALCTAGDENIYFVNGLDLLGEADKHLMPDHVHPNAEGYRLIAKRYWQQLVTLELV